MMTQAERDQWNRHRALINRLIREGFTRSEATRRAAEIMKENDSALAGTSEYNERRNKGKADAKPGGRSQ